MKILSVWLIVEFAIKLMICKKDLSTYDYIKASVGSVLTWFWAV